MDDRKMVDRAEGFGSSLRLLGFVVATLGAVAGLLVIVFYDPGGIRTSGSTDLAGLVGGSIIAGSGLLALGLAWAGYVVGLLVAIWRRWEGPGF